MAEIIGTCPFVCCPHSLILLVKHVFVQVQFLPKVLKITQGSENSDGKWQVQGVRCNCSHCSQTSYLRIRLISLGILGNSKHLLHFFSPCRSVSQELSETILTMVANCSNVMNKARQPPPGVMSKGRPPSASSLDAISPVQVTKCYSSCLVFLFIVSE